MLFFSGCGAKKYRVDYDGSKEWFKGAKDAYRAGATVTVYYDMIATDTDYSFYVDDERLNCLYRDGKGYEISFVMPDHDVKITVEERNSMLYVPPTEPGPVFEKNPTLSFHSFDGGGPQYSAEIEDPNIVSYSSERVYANKNHEKMCGSGYSVIFTFTGLKPGTTTMIIKGSSPIVPEEEYTYEIIVDEDLRIALSETEPSCDE